MACALPFSPSATEPWAWNALNEYSRNAPPKLSGFTGTANCLDSLPSASAHAAKKAIQNIYNAGDKERAAAAVKAFAKYSAKPPRPSRRSSMTRDELLTFLRFPRRVNAPTLSPSSALGPALNAASSLDRSQTTAA
ncbi:transposase [Streptomyces sp. KL116D]|uniref:transposase n=1 Tax=Streptomyces sp. KL116D TaxID=3045152 RepID=UPI00355851F4